MIHQEDMAEIAERGHEIFNRKIEPSLSPKDKGKYVAIDVDSEEHAVARTGLLALQRIHELHPGCRAFLMRVGHRTAVKFGRRTRVEP